MRKQFGHIEKLVAISMQGKPISMQQHTIFFSSGILVSLWQTYINKIINMRLTISNALNILLNSHVIQDQGNHCPRNKTTTFSSFRLGILFLSEKHI